MDLRPDLEFLLPGDDFAASKKFAGKSTASEAGVHGQDAALEDALDSVGGEQVQASVHSVQEAENATELGVGDGRQALLGFCEVTLSLDAVQGDAYDLQHFITLVDAI